MVRHTPLTMWGFASSLLHSPGWRLVQTKLHVYILPPDAVQVYMGVSSSSLLCLGEVECLICNFCLRVAAPSLVREDPSLRYTSMLLGR